MPWFNDLINDRLVLIKGIVKWEIMKMGEGMLNTCACFVSNVK